jgi:hypothetical protein
MYETVSLAGIAHLTAILLPELLIVGMMVSAQEKSWR